MVKNISALVTVGFLTAFIMITFGFGRNIFPMVIPDMKSTFHFKYTAVGLVTALHQIAYLSFSYVSGRLSLLVDSARLVKLSVLVCGVCLILMGVVDKFWIVGGLFVISGACAALSWIPMVNVVNRLVPEKHLSKAMGFISSGTSYGVFLIGFGVPIIGGHYGWKMVWIVFGVFTEALFFLSVFLFRYNQTLQFGEIETKVSRDHSRPSVDKTRIVWISLLMFLTGLAFIPFQTYLIPYLREELGFSLELGGRVWNIIGLAGIISGLIMGTLADSISIRLALLITYTLMVISAAIVSFVAFPLTILLSALFFGIAYFGTFGLIPVYISKVISKRHSASIFGISNLALGVGSAIGNYLGGWSRSLTQSFRWIYIAVCLICVVLFLVALKLENDKETKTDPGGFPDECGDCMIG